MTVPNESTKNEAQTYFRDHSSLHRFLDALIAKYQKYGRLTEQMNVTIKQPGRDELEAYFTFFHKDFHGMKKVRITVAQFANALKATKFASLTPLEILTLYHGKPLHAKAEAKAEHDRRRQLFYDQFLNKYTHENCRYWLRLLYERRPQARRVLILEKKEPPLFASHLDSVLKALSELPDSYERLPLFSNRICGDPHGFDLSSTQGGHLLAALASLEERANHGENELIKEANKNERQTALLYRFRLIRDDLHNFVTCCGLLGYNKSKVEEWWRQCWLENVVLNIPLREIVRVDALSPAPLKDGSPCKVVYIVENSGVFSALADSCTGSAPPLICTHGHFRLAAWSLLDRVARSEVTFLYAGDFDPEGLIMAQQISLRFPDNTVLWRMNREEYFRSNPRDPISKASLKKLSAIHIPELKPLVQAIAEKGCAGYQESLLDLYLKDICSK